MLLLARVDVVSLVDNCVLQLPVTEHGLFVAEHRMSLKHELRRAGSSPVLVSGRATKELLLSIVFQNKSYSKVRASLLHICRIEPRNNCQTVSSQDENLLQRVCIATTRTCV